MSRKGGTGGDGLVHPKGENSMAVSGNGCENPSVGPFLLLYVTANGPTKESSYLVGSPYSIQGIR